MKEQIQFYTEQLISSAKREAIEEAKAMLFQKSIAIETLLERGHNILVQSYGERFDKLYSQRLKLFAKHQTYMSIMCDLDQLRYNY